jgi:hypothetical protein
MSRSWTYAVSLCGTSQDVEREGFDEWEASVFVEFFCEHMNCKPDTEVTRIEWRYL